MTRADEQAGELPARQAPPARGTRRLRLLLVGDDALARSGLAVLLAAEPSLEVVAQLDSATAFAGPADGDRLPAADGGAGEVEAAAVAALVQGLLVIDEALGPRLLRQRPAGPALAEPLTARELEVLDLLAEGLSNKQIAGRLAISELADTRLPSFVVVCG